VNVPFQVPPPGKGSLYIRPLLMGSGAVLGLAPAPEYTFLIYVSPVGNYFKVGFLLELGFLAQCDQFCFSFRQDICPLSFELLFHSHI
jgi:hypothetical protein